MIEDGTDAFLALGAVVLAVTGAEALYTDMGHFGRLPIRLGVVPAGAAGADAQLLRPGRAAAHPSRRHRKPVLPSGARTGPVCRWSCSPPPPPSSRRRR